MASEETEKSTVQQAIDQGRNAAEKASQTVQDGYTAAQQYAEDKGLDVGDFVRREPWLAITAALGIGYVVARVIRRVS